ncbi:hypothetical protein FOIG_00073 [Fusarium odoratissimum NRRL 54006]|uniref:Uncharacterized protein n=1 Tax=Fusarium odoratissimum (strain NRRL 54006) TaxID=1089451 RepID=X0K8D1_FUSO5|nr:uncharacterized protein FOIG_00073 [Fusarium odoratissimum NRRL 54006]EXM09728.1 hypothetical protein FOIG_00073 [Fusarium odoratissimum NRRL 54006]
MTTSIVETTATLGVLEAEHAEMREVSLNINVENEMDTNSDVEMEYNAGVPVQDDPRNLEDEMDTNSDVEMEYNAGVPVQDDPRELAAATSGQSLRVAMLEMPGGESTVLQVKARCTSQSRLEIEAYIIIEGHSKRTIDQASLLLARETDAESFFTATQGNSPDVTLPIPGYQDRVLRAEARWDSRYGFEMMCGISNDAACLKF